MGLFTGMNISASALSAQKLRFDLIANNIAREPLINNVFRLPNA